MLNKVILKKHSSGFFNETSLVFLFLGASLTLIFPPYNYFFLAPIVMAIIFYACITLKPKQAAIYLFFFGVGFNLFGVYWIYISIHIFGNAPIWVAIILMIALVILMSLYIAIAGLLISWLVGKRKITLIFLGPSVWVLLEWAKGWVFTGFPWLTIGYSQIDTYLAGWAPILGVYGVSWLLLFSSCSFLFFCIKARFYLAFSALLAPYLVGYFVSVDFWTENFDKPISVKIVQGGVSQDLKWKKEQLSKTMNLYKTATFEAEKNTLIIWPEVAIPASLNIIEPFINDISNHIGETNKKLAFGVLEQQKNSNNSYNSLMFLDDEKRQFYRKRHLVPFGEYFPVPNFIREWMRMKNLPNIDLLKGETDQSLIQYNDNVKIASAICYEIAFASEQLNFFPDANLIINISNDAWFGDSIAPHHHLQITRMRALETGRYLIRSTNNGISAFIDPEGKIVKRSGQFDYEVLNYEVHPRTGSTPFVIYGNWLILLSSLLIIFISLSGLEPVKNRKKI